jgi:hypothetical protein
MWFGCEGGIPNRLLLSPVKLCAKWRERICEVLNWGMFSWSIDKGCFRIDDEDVPKED